MEALIWTWSGILALFATLAISDGSSYGWDNQVYGRSYDSHQSARSYQDSHDTGYRPYEVEVHQSYKPKRKTSEYEPNHFVDLQLAEAMSMFSEGHACYTEYAIAYVCMNAVTKALGSFAKKLLKIKVLHSWCLFYLNSPFMVTLLHPRLQFASSLRLRELENALYACGSPFFLLEASNLRSVINFQTRTQRP